MIVTKLDGGLGNQLFQYAIGRCLANKHKTKLKFDVEFYDDKKDSYHNHYKLDAFNVKESFATPKELEHLQLVKQTIIDNKAIEFEPHFMDSPDNIILEGYWHSESYFYEVADIIRQEFTLKKPLSKTSAEWKKKILAAECAVSVHVRHGDYLFYASRNNRGLLSAGYYLDSIKTLLKDCPNITLFIFSDDIDWCKENFKFDVPTEFIEGCEYDFEEMYLMSCCRHNIIANSTFSWWGAWLNPNPNKKVFAPDPWILCLDWKDIVPDRWIKIPVDYSTGIAPLLSMIIYVENNLSKIDIALQGALAQIPINYEIILVDASNDGSGDICRRATQDPRVNFVRANFPPNKFAAWNKGLDIARGHQVIFLKADDLILPRIGIVAGICDDAIFPKIVGKKRHLNYKNYWYEYPKVISATQMLEEDENGKININGIPDKKFTVKVDNAFQGLNTLAEINLSAQQKLMALGSQGINGLVGTKFFKRKFLEENNIRFNENDSVNAELAFVVNAFMATEKITFVPQLFYGRMK